LVGFWVHMSSEVASVPHLGRLRLLLIPRNVTGQVDQQAEPSVLWSLSNQQDSEWFYAQASFTPSVPYLLVFEGLRANTVVLGTIGLDDVTIFPSECTLKPARAIIDPRDCSFEFDLCGWKSLNPGDTTPSGLRHQDWKLADRSHKLGSLQDHTFRLENRGYVFFDTSSIQTQTWLASPVIEANSLLCLQFWFAAKTRSASNLIVRRQYNGTMKEIWRIEIPSSDHAHWSSAQVPLETINTRSQVFFEGNSDSGGFAVDDIKFSSITSLDECEKRPLNANVTPDSTFRGLQIFN